MSQPFASPRVHADAPYLIGLVVVPVRGFEPLA